MVGRVTVQVTGFRELEARLRELPNRTRGAVLTRALRRAAEPMRAAAQAGAPRDEGTLSGSIMIGTRITSNQRRFDRGFERATKQINIGPSSDGSTGVLNYAHLTEFGPQGTAWFTRAYEAHKEGAVRLLSAELQSAIEKSLRRGSGR